MKTIEIDDDIYEYLRKQQTTFNGESASVLLRRLLKLESSNLPTPSVKTPKRPLSPELREALQHTSDEIQRDERKKALWEFFKEPQFRATRNAVGKFLALLALLERENPDKFAVVGNIDGRSRKYFAKSEAELEQSGMSVNAKRIPGSEYWVVTNNSTVSKAELLRRVMKMLGYDDGFAAFVSLRCFTQNSDTKAA